MLTEKDLLGLLSKSEVTVYEYIKAMCEQNNGKLKQSMSDIGESLGGLSEATVHRTVRKLRKEGIIGINSSVEKAEPNEIVYYGIPDPDQQVNQILDTIKQLNGMSERFETILAAKDRTIEQSKRDKELMLEQIDRLELEIERLRGGHPFDPARIISYESLEDGTTAYLVRDDLPEQ